MSSPGGASESRAGRATRPQIRLLHTSDLHLGADIGITGTAWHGRRCVCPLAAVARLAEQEGCQLLLIAGDLFDSNRVPDAVIEDALGVLGDLSIPCVIVPGNHDAYDETSIYRRVDFQGRVPHVHVVSRESGQMVTFESMSTSVWAKPVVVHDQASRPLAGTPPHPGDGWYVVAGHGQFTGRQRYLGLPPASPITDAELATIEANYVALGHEDVAGPVGNGGAPTWYSGAPHAAGDAAAALLVTLDVALGVRVEARSVPTLDVECAAMVTRTAGR